MSFLCLGVSALRYDNPHRLEQPSATRFTLSLFQFLMSSSCGYLCIPDVMSPHVFHFRLCLRYPCIQSYATLSSVCVSPEIKYGYQTKPGWHMNRAAFAYASHAEPMRNSVLTLDLII
jgi:hypothetical protein